MWEQGLEFCPCFVPKQEHNMFMRYFSFIFPSFLLQEERVDP